MSSNVSSTLDWHWLRDVLIALLASPHSPSGVDPFSVQYDKIFTDDVEGVMAAKHVKKNGLKEALLTVQKGWDPESAIFEAEYAPQPRQVCRFVKFTSKLSKPYDCDSGGDSLPVET